MTKQARSSFIRSRAMALRFSSLAVSPHSLSSPSTLPSAHVWRKTGKAQDDTSEALPANYVPAVIPAPFVPAIDKAIDAEVRPQAYAEALPEIGFHHFSHLANCAPLCLTWNG